jgi:hypothetical protein
MTPFMNVLKKALDIYLEEDAALKLFMVLLLVGFIVGVVLLVLGEYA